MRTAKRPASGLPSIPSSTGGIARLACARLRDARIDLTPILSAVGLTIGDVENPALRIAASAQVSLLEIAAKELHDDCFGFHLAQGFQLGEIGLLYYAMASSERLVDALHAAERYCAINNEGVRLQTSLEQGFAIGFEYVDIDRRADRHHMEFWLIALVRICRALTDARLAPKQIKLKHGRGEIPRDVRSQLGCSIEFSADRDEILFPSQIGALPLVRADLHLNKILLQYADEALTNRPSRRASMRSRVEDQIAQLLPHGKANAAEVARRLGMSRRTLSRALSSEGAGFLDILEAFRNALARRYLMEEELPISEIAWLLGYSEVSSFTHAFVRWAGVTPRAYRSSNGSG
ncbi:AraC family transcriptional regulator ligand-binding domain-containing protein [Bradyrhizobium sp. KB893862 SZCCT0404]|uniref:AraC family transcriptional regulator n=1 Tax=Bradyrhizobium sp. KB893862 SZCCT0404 TaxID=2807672 RepID=UPI001BAD0F95|nr:AraC family transcriptional regulator [Bradyrhizobium sp. KB893862 SZCCT0404]MBR1175023.1 AraC family transcriptional regulator ligand-binding domain-containing protein [Bradyrhizobium sp. KB893862 SZCCT0404]